MKIKYMFLLGLIALTGCGEALVEVDQANYEPKIVFQAYLYPEKPVENIVVQRNFALNTSISREDIPLASAQVILRDLAASKDYTLEFDAASKAFEYPGSDLQIGYNKSYRLTVNGRIDGQDLTASSTTTTPKPGFDILEEQSDLEPRNYFSVNQFGLPDSYDLMLQLSPETEFYALSVKALDVSFSSYIYNSPYAAGQDSAEVAKEFEEDGLDPLIYNYTWAQDLEASKTNFFFPIDWYMMAFYGRYRGIMYAGDKNFKDYMITNQQVQEIDGNFHEPILHIDGDGIGVFGSAIVDTVYFEVLR